MLLRETSRDTVPDGLLVPFQIVKTVGLGVRKQQPVVHFLSLLKRTAGAVGAPCVAARNVRSFIVGRATTQGRPYAKPKFPHTLSLRREEGSLARLQTENFAHRGVASPVDRQGSQFFEEPAMLRRRIPFVRRKAVAGVDPIVLLHQS